MTTSRKPSWSRALRALIKTEHGFGWLISEARMESRRYPLNTHHQTGQTSFLEIGTPEKVRSTAAQLVSVIESR
jgi:hypothetical protein